MSATSTVWLVDELGNRIPGTDKTLTFELTDRWRLEARETWTMPQAATVAGYEVIGFVPRFLLDDAPQPLKKRQDLDLRIWLTVGPGRFESDAWLAYMRDEITLDEFEQRIGATA